MNQSTNRAPARGGFRHGSSSGGYKKKPNFTHKKPGAYRGERGTQRRSSGGRGRGGGRGRAEPVYDINRFINKAEPIAEQKVYEATHKFKDFGMSPRLVSACARRKYEIPSQIQDQAIPYVMAGKDVIGLSSTGTGKTAAFLLPLLDKVIRDKKSQTLILAPTRELAMQIDEELHRFTNRSMDIFSVVCVGGMPIRRQISGLKRPHNFVIGTPGRIMDLMKQGVLSLKDTHSIVLDEADRMLDMGFVNDMRFIMEQMPKKRQTVFFSATMSNEIKKIVNDFLNDPVTVTVPSRETSKNVDQDVVSIAGRDKVEILHGLLGQGDFSKVLVFGKTKRGVDNLSRQLNQKGHNTDALHGDKNQSQRKRAVDKFKAGGIRVLVATDVAARGIDISGITHVINYDLPESYEDYVHRIGRTGRASEIGKALTFVK